MWLALDVMRALAPRLRAASEPVRPLHGGTLFLLLTIFLYDTRLATEVMERKRQGDASYESLLHRQQR